jgi:hypothetical protein
MITVWVLIAASIAYGPPGPYAHTLGLQETHVAEFATWAACENARKRVEGTGGVAWYCRARKVRR